jgi:hypothetical protein
VGNKLCMMKPSMHIWHSSCSSIRTEKIIIMWLWIGHTLLTYSHLLRGDLAPFF